jgi:hypothetical protein
MLACGGKRGAAGERGERGPKGEEGRPGVGFASWRVDRKDYRVVAVLTDGTESVLQLRELFEQYQRETR